MSCVAPQTEFSDTQIGNVKDQTSELYFCTDTALIFTQLTHETVKNLVLSTRLLEPLSHWMLSR
jgi:hypothetical protein